VRLSTGGRSRLHSCSERIGVLLFFFLWLGAGTAAADWSPPVTVTEGGTQYTFGQDVSTDGTGTVVWSGPLPGGDGYAIYTKDVEADGTTGTKRVISAAPPTAAFTSAYAPAIRYDAAGTATVVWLESAYSSDSCFSEGDEPQEDCVVDEYLRSRQIGPTGSLSTISVLRHRQVAYPEDGSFGGSSPAYVTYGQPTLTGGPSDTLTVLWTESTFESGCAAYGYSSSYADAECEANTSIEWVRLSAAAAPLSSPKSAHTVKTTGYGSGHPLVRLRAGAASDGTATVLFSTRTSTDESSCWGGESTVGFLRISAAGAAGSASQLDAGCGTVSPELAIDPSGAAIAVWGWAGTYSADEALYARIGAAGAAESPQGLLEPGEGTHVGGLDVARVEPGGARAVWIVEGAVRSRRIPAAGNLGAVTTVASPPAERTFSSPRMAATADGSAAISWETVTDSGQGLEVATLTAGGAASAPRPLLSINRQDHGSRVSPGPGGTFMVSWRVSVPRHNRIQAARFGTAAVKSNDAFADARSLDGELPDFASGSNAGASREPSEPDHAGDPGGHSVWYSWKPSTSGPVTLSTCAAGALDPVLAVYTGSSLAGLTPVAGAKDGAPSPCATGDSGVRFDAVAGTVYRIAVDGQGGSTGTFGLKLLARENPPANDAFAAAKAIVTALPTYAFGTNADGSREPGEPNHAGKPGGASVWYSWTATETRTATISVCGEGLEEPLLGVYTGSALGSVSAVTTTTGTPECSRNGTAVRFEAVAGTTYRIAVDGAGREGRFRLRLAQRPANDDLAQAKSLSVPSFYVYGSTEAATKQAGEPDHAGNPGGHSVWYSFTPTTSGTAFVSVCLSTGKDQDALLGVYTGPDVTHLTAIASDRGSEPADGCYSHYSEVRLDYKAGTTYWIAVDATNGGEASFSLRVEPLPGNDDLAGAHPVPSIGSSFGNYNLYATKQAGEPNHAGDPGGHSLWYSWTPASSGTAFLSACLSAGKEAPALLAVYTGSTIGDLTEVGGDAGSGSTSGCSSHYSEVRLDYKAGTTYLIAMDGKGGATGFLSLRVELAPANDDFAAAKEISGNPPGSISDSNRRASKQPGEPNHAGDPGGASVWYSWTPASSGFVTLSVCTPFSANPLLAVYTGADVAHLTEVASGRGNGTGFCSPSSGGLELEVDSATRYYIAVDSPGGAGAQSFTLNLTLERVPGNDDFANALVLGSGPSTRSGSNRHATKQPGEPDHAGKPGGASVWYSWTPTSSGTFGISVCASDFDPVLAVYTGSTLAGLSSVAGNDNAAGGECSSHDSEVRIAAVAGTTYRIAVDGAGGGSGFFALALTGTPANDDLAAATSLSGSLPTTAFGSNRLGSKQAGEPNHAGDPGGASVWYSWTAPSAGTVRVSVCGFGSLDPLLGIYTGSAPETLQAVAGAGADPGCSGNGAAIRFAATANTTYLIAVDGRANSSGSFLIDLRGTPANDDFAFAESLAAALPQTTWGDNRVATKQAGEPNHAGDPGGASVWYSWTPTSSGPIKISTCSFSHLDPVLAVYAGSSVNGLAEVATDTDTAPAGCWGKGASVRFDAVAGTVYRIAIDGEGGSESDFQLELREAGPANDDFEAATEVPQDRALVPGTTLGASTQPGENSSASQTVWYRMVATHNGIVRLHTCSDVGAPMDIDVFTGSAIGALSQVPVISAGTISGCNFPPPASHGFGGTPGIAFQAVAGTTYRIAVGRYFQISPEFVLKPAGPFQLVVEPPANDLISSAENVPVIGGSISRSNAGATHEVGEDGHAGNPGGGSVWFRWFARADGPATIDTCGSSIDTLLAVRDFEGERAASDDSDACGPGSTAGSVTFAAKEDTFYNIAVDGKGGAEGDFELHVSFATPDTTPPDTSAFVPPAVNSSLLNFSAARDEPGSHFECAVDGAQFTACSPSGDSEFAQGQVGGLTEGTHTLAIREVDLAGNADPTPKEAQVTVDLVAPQTTLIEGPQGLTRLRGPFGFTSNEPGGFECALDEGPFSFCSPPHLVPDSLADGNHTLKVRAVDVAGNRDASPASRSFDLDRTPPTIALQGPGGTVGSGNVSFSFSPSESAVLQCSLDDEVTAGCISPRSYTNLGDGQHLFKVRGTDPAGNVGEFAERSFRVEARPPQTLIEDAPPARVNAATAHFEFGADEDAAGFECALDDDAFAACPASHDVSGLGEGEHAIRVRATDLAGKQDPTPAEASWLVDTDPPETTIASGPSGVTRLLGPFTFSADEAVSGYECALDDEAEFAACSSGHFLPSLPDGSHTLWVRAIDAAGNADPAPATRTIALDRTPPVVEVLSGPPPVAEGTVTVTFAIDDESAFAQCRIDGQVYFRCASPIEFKGIPDGPHAIFLRGVDKAGNVGAEVQVDFTVDEQPPDTLIDKAPEYATDGSTIAFHGSADAGDFACALDEDEFSACESPFALQGLEEGPHRFQVRAIDGGGNVDPSPAEASFVVDRTAPQTTITEHPNGPVHDPLLPFRYESSEQPEEFECAIDDGEFRSCVGLSHDRQPGSHTFAVRARDRAGNVDPTPATFPFEVVDEPPVAVLTLSKLSGPAPLTLSAGADGSDPDHDDLGYELQWGDESSTQGFAPESELTHKYTEPGLYLVQLEVDDGYGGTDTASHLVTVTAPEPVSAHAGDDLTVTAGEPVLLDGAGSRPLGGLDTYHWSLGDGSTGSGARLTHTFDQPGDYEAQLTVTGIGGTDTDAVHIQVVPHSPAPTVFVHSGPTPLPGARVFVSLPAGGSVSADTGPDGIARLRGLPDGSYKVYANKPGYVPSTGNLDVAGDTGSGDVSLSPGPAAAVTVDSRRMTLDEIEAVGIDPDDPANQHVYEFRIDGKFGGYINRDGFAGGGGCTRTLCRSGNVISTSRWSKKANAPILASMRIPARATFLKEFYDVSVTVTNLARDPDINLEDGSAEISVPEGMSLAPTATPQSYSRRVADVPGGSSTTLHWFLRGDREDSYHIAVFYAGSLEPFGESIDLEGRTAEPIKVWGGSALRLEVDLDEDAGQGYPYTAFIKLKNVADVPVYNPLIELQRDGRLGYIEQPRQRHSYGLRELAPGATHTAGPFVFVPEENGSIDLAASVVRKVAGDVDLGGKIVTHKRSPSFEDTPKFTGRWRNDEDLILKWDQVPGASGYELYTTPDRKTEFGPNPIALSNQLGPNKVMVTLDRDDPPLLALSSIVDGERRMVHPLLNGAAAPLVAYPSIEFEDETRCGEPVTHAKVIIEDPDFELTGWGSSTTESGVVANKPLSGHKFEDHAQAGRPGASRLATLVVGARNTNPADGTRKVSTQLGRCDYVSLGDSFSAGVGALLSETESYEAGGEDCRRSKHAYAHVLADRREDVTLDHFKACVGAVSADLERRNPDHLDEGPQAEGVEEADLVTLSMGGNDVGFGPVLKDCMAAYVLQVVSHPLPAPAPCKIAAAPYVEVQLDVLKQTLPDRLRRLRDAMAENGKLILVGYPIFFPESKPIIPSWACAALHPSDISWMHDVIIRVNHALAGMVPAGVQFVDPNVVGEFEGHDVCQRETSKAYFHGIRGSLDDYVESFHPKIEGQLELADAVADELDDPAGAATPLMQGQSFSRRLLIEGSNVLRAQIGWPGSDVELSLESPAGEVIDRSHVPGDVNHVLTGTSESYEVPDPEAGEWKLTATALEVDEGGEPVSFEATQAPPEAEPPLALFQFSPEQGPPPLQIHFDASASFDPSGQALTYSWDFGDGTGASGPTPTHAYSGEGEYVAVLTVTDQDGETDTFESLPIAVRAETVPNPTEPAPTEPDPGGSGSTTPGGPSSTPAGAPQAQAPSSSPTSGPSHPKTIKCKKGWRKKTVHGKPRCLKAKKHKKKRKR